MKNNCNGYKAVTASILLLLTATFYALPSLAQRHITEYYLTLREQKVNKAGKLVKAITVNDSLPAPTLYLALMNKNKTDMVSVLLVSEIVKTMHFSAFRFSF